MKNLIRFCAISVAALLSCCCVAQGQASQSGCPSANPASRPAGIHPSLWNLTKVLQYLKTPTAQTPGGLVVLISHRGNWEFCPENTLESFQSAWDLGAEGAEMDVRLSAPGTDSSTGTTYSAGEIFLSHDWDLRGEAPNADLTQPTQNTIYNLTPDQIRARTMVDRHGKFLTDSGGHSLHMASFSDLLMSVYNRAVALNIVGTSPRKAGWKYVGKGTLLVVDVKGLNNNAGWMQYPTFIEAVKELYAFEVAHQIDLGDAIAFKVQFKDFQPYSASTVLSSVTGSSIGYIAGLEPPRLIFIVFPEDLCVPHSTSSTPCTLIQPTNNTSLNDYLHNYPDFLVNDWQHRDEGDAVTNYLTDPLWAGRGVASFLASNNFAEGVRNSGGDCLNGFSDAAIIGPKPSPYFPPINTSYCVSDPLQRWSSASLDYLIPSFSPQHATSVTTDLYQNAADYLTSIGLNSTNLLLP